MTEQPSSRSAAATTAELPLARLLGAKTAYTTRFIAETLQSGGPHFLVGGQGVVPRSGDVVLARVEELGQHERIELPSGRRARLLEGDEVLVAYGNRYAPDQFEAEVPAGLGVTSLVAAGGVAGDVVSCHEKMLPATTLRPLGLLADLVGLVNLSRFSPYRLVGDSPATGSAPTLTIAVLGTSMNSGKTTTVASMVRGLARSGRRVCAGKVTGTGAGGDPGFFVDAGASRVLDFTDFGHSSTYRLPSEEVASLFTALHSELCSGGADVVVLEVADGLLQPETAGLVSCAAFGSAVDTVVFAAADAMAAEAGVRRLRALDRHVSAVSGVLTRSPLTTAEARAVLDVPVLASMDLQDPRIAGTFSGVAGSALPAASEPSASGGEIRVAV